MYSKCQKCGKKLTDPESIKRGYAPNAGNSTAPDQQCRERIGKQKYVLTVEQSRHLTL